jgi:surface protein
VAQSGPTHHAGCRRLTNKPLFWSSLASCHNMLAAARAAKTHPSDKESTAEIMDEAPPRQLNAVLSLLPDDLLLPILSHLDVKTLIEKKEVCRSWRHTCTQAINAKPTKAFSTNEELCEAVKKYTGQCSPQEAEEFAQTYGYPINQWDVSAVQDFQDVFSHADTFNEDISSWNVSNVTDMSWMFFKASSFNQDLSSWNVSKVTDMKSMFGGASSFNQDLSSWNVSNATNMSYMFSGASSFNHNMSSWNVSNVTNMVLMFHDASSFNQDLSSWNVFNVTNMNSMFEGTSSFNQDVSSWNVSNVIDMSCMFQGARSFNQDLSSWNVSNVTSMCNMFYGANSFNQDLSSWNVSNVTERSSMFVGASSFNQDLSPWNVPNVTYMSYMSGTRRNRHSKPRSQTPQPAKHFSRLTSFFARLPRPTNILRRAQPRLPPSPELPEPPSTVGAPRRRQFRNFFPDHPGEPLTSS